MGITRIEKYYDYVVDSIVENSDFYGMDGKGEFSFFDRYWVSDTPFRLVIFSIS